MKSEIRREILKKRDAIGREEIAGKSSLIERNLFSAVRFISSDVCAFYASFRSEVSTYGMILRCIGMGKKVLLPITMKINHELVFCVVKSLDELKPGAMGIPEPDHQHIVPYAPEDIDAMIVPGVAFDAGGYRIGYGGGYYDRVTEKLRPDCFKIGLAFECQIIDKVPREKYDMRVDSIITEDRILDITQP